MRRRDVLRLSALAGAAGALTLDPVTFPDAAAQDGQARDGQADGGGREETRTVTGHLPVGAPDFVYLPVEVPRGAREIAVSYTYDSPRVPPGTQGNACDIGIFDERGTALGGRGFRGWSGGARTEFAISAEQATPGYVPGPVRPGTWHVVLGPYTVAPEGLRYDVTVTVRYGASGRTPAPVYPPHRAKGRGRAWYRGDCHLHTVYSDGKRTPAEVAAAARAAGLDFITTTEHNTHSGHRAWDGLWGDDLLILTGEEVTTRNGHVVALGVDPGVFIDWRYRARDNAFGRYAREIRRAGGLVVPAHPHATCVGCNWKFGFNEADAVEVWNGPYTADDEMTIAEWDNTLVAAVRGPGRGWLPAMGNSDAHREPQVVGLPQTVVLADDLSREAIQEGLRAGRSWIAESSAIDLSFEAVGGRGQHAGIGERLAVAGDEEVTVRLRVSGAPGCGVRFVTDQGQLYATMLSASGTGAAEWRTTSSYAAYVRAEVRHPPADGGASGLPGAMAALTNPIWLGGRDTD
ncbi:CehA/McbA family metallohydrolase [Streptomyces sp. B1866]|uniref:CehA/McbA family metallohydrolase n=1 Tax=Streptomyces sp. B1866 TaxID=3075431 RepID=UPI0028927670|nr:CehA/McbA family metallohydrolase [Streptomyces sp. B1866]MDT3398469.1 CehA/McbA family metallohydrolase [Streptomyces sp. B1866]